METRIIYKEGEKPDLHPIKIDRVKLDCTKITTLEEVKLILDGLELHIMTDSKNYDKLKHLTEGE